MRGRAPRRFPPPWSVKEQPVLFLWLWRNTEESFVYLLPERIDGISPQADGDRALTHGFRVEAS